MQMAVQLPVALITDQGSVPIPLLDRFVVIAIEILVSHRSGAGVGVQIPGKCLQSPLVCVLG